jgi:hypothetical protein
MPSPTCTVNHLPTTDGVNVTSESLVTIRLADHAGVTSWSLECVDTDERTTPTAINDLLTVNSTTKQATFTMLPDGYSLIFVSTVNGGVDLDGRAQASYSTRFKVASLTEIGTRVIATNQTYEGSASHGLVPYINPLLRSGGTATLSGVNGVISSTADENRWLPSSFSPVKVVEKISTYQTNTDGSEDTLFYFDLPSDGVANFQITVTARDQDSGHFATFQFDITATWTAGDPIEAWGHETPTSYGSGGSGALPPASSAWDANVSFENPSPGVYRARMNVSGDEDTTINWYIKGTMFAGPAEL